VNEAEKPDVFYMVYAQGGHSPTTKHVSRRSANQEALRITEKTNMPCYVLRAVGMFYAVQVTTPTYKVQGVSLGDCDEF